MSFEVDIQLSIREILVGLENIARIAIALRIIMRRMNTGVTLSWLALVTAVPVVGSIIYLVLGESRIGSQRAEREAKLTGPYLEILDASRIRPASYWLRGPFTPDGRRARGLELTDAHLWQHGSPDKEGLSVPPHSAGLFRQSETITDFPAASGNTVELLSDPYETLARIRDEIEGATRSVHMLFYIWSAGGMADEVADALERAVGRGVRCRLALDDVGSRAFLRSKRAKELQEAGIEIVGMLPVGVIRAAFVRADLRNHRKIVVIDGERAYTGSMNLVDPRFFKQDKDLYGQWVDAMLCIEGPVVEHLHMLLLQDWELETGHSENISNPLEFFESNDLRCQLERGPVIAQLVPSGPGRRNGTLLEILVSSLYAAQREVVLTTPYFVPDVTLLTAILSAEHRGVDVHLVVPETVDSRLVHYAGRSFFEELLEAGVEIHLFQDGLLHTKSITVDGATAAFGTMNFDHRSFWLNFELMMLLRDQAITAEIYSLQQEYMKRSRSLSLEEWRSRPSWQPFAENVSQLFSPLL